MDATSLATPPLNATVANVVVPVLKVTLPVAALGDTVAVSVTVPPAGTGFGDAVSVVVVAVFTTTLIEDEVEAVSTASPL